MKKRSRRGLVMLSGGQDSATCLAIAGIKCYEVHTVSFDYGQRHLIELDMAERLANIAKVKRHHTVPINSFGFIDDSALLTSEVLSGSHRGNQNLPASFVPGRNLVFVTLAAALLYKIKGDVLYGGMNQTDYSGYPDCRKPALTYIHNACQLGMDYSFELRLPLLNKTKVETVNWMLDLGKFNWYKHTHTCYNGERPPCMECPACIIRQKGFDEAGVKDPLLDA